MTGGLAFYGILGVLSTAYAFVANRRLFRRGGGDGTSVGTGRVSALEALFAGLGVVSLGLGWYFNVRYVHADHHATYTSYTKALFANWADDSAAQDYIMVNLVLLPLWTIVDGRRRGLRAPWIFFVMSLFTSLAFAMAWYLAFVERQIRFNRSRGEDGVGTPGAQHTGRRPSGGDPQPAESSTA